MESKRITSIVLGSIGFIASIFSILTLFFDNPIKPEKRISAEIFTQSQLQFGNKIDSLDVLYLGSEASNLWRVKVNLKNSGRKPLVGEGDDTDIIYDTVLLICPDNCKLISYYVIGTDFSQTLLQIDNNLAISFRKWNPKEKLEIVIMMSFDEPLSIPPTVEFNLDCFGRVKFSKKQLDFSENEIESEKLNWLRKAKSILPHFQMVMIKWFLYLFGFAFLVMPLYGSWMAFSNPIIYYRWRKKYYLDFKQKIEELEMDGQDKAKYLKRPCDTPSDIQNLIDMKIPENELLTDILSAALAIFLSPTGALVILFAKNLL